MMAGFGLKLLSEQDILLMCSADPVTEHGGRGGGVVGRRRRREEWMGVDVAAAVTDAC